MIDYNIDIVKNWTPFFPSKESIIKFTGEPEIYAI